MQRDIDGTLMEGSDEESSSEEEGDQEMQIGDTQADIAKQGPLIDDDGFQLVQSKRGSRSKG